MRSRRCRLGLGAICAAAAIIVAAAPAWGAAIFDFESPAFNGPCGLAVDAQGRFYVSDYHHEVVDIFKPPHEPAGALQGANAPGEGPCGLAVDSAGTLYVNRYHRDVVRYKRAFPAFGPGTVIDSAHSTGVAVDPATGNVYVDARTYVAVYDSSGAPVLDEGEPLRIGEGSLGDGYGVAVSGFSKTQGRVYVPDAADGTVKIYDPSGDEDVADEILAGFVSLRDAAIAIDDETGVVYVVDDLEPAFFEQPQAEVKSFTAAGVSEGRFGSPIVNARPAGLAVDNSGTATQGRVYVTSGNSTPAVVSAYNSALVPAFAPPVAVDPGFGEIGPEASGQGTAQSPSVFSAAGALDAAAISTPVLAPRRAGHGRHRHVQRRAACRRLRHGCRVPRGRP